MCNYNYGRFIAEAMDSVLKQTYTHFELIIVDDGSTDNSRKVIQSYNDPRIRVIFQPNQGQAAAFNAGFTQSCGELIAFLDSDDRWEPEKLKKTIRGFHHFYIPISLVQHNLQMIDVNSQPLNQIHPRIDSGIRDVLKLYLREQHTGFFSATSGIVCQRSALNHVFPLDESWRICADVALTRPLPIFGQIFTLEEPLGYYRVHDHNNWMNSDKQRQVAENQNKFNEYTNKWLINYGVVGRIDYKRYHQRIQWQKFKRKLRQGIVSLPGIKSLCILRDRK
jgi:glycosyltransferase involved in cell wall biosynthesis